MVTMEKVHYKLQGDVRNNIQACSDDGHVQQVAYSTYHDCLTQTCFTCERVRTNLDEEDLE